MTQAQTSPSSGSQLTKPPFGGPPTQEVGLPMVVTLVEAPACHFCEDAKSNLATLAKSYPMTINVVSVLDEPGRSLMQEHRAPMSPLVLLDGAYFSSGRRRL